MHFNTDSANATIVGQFSPYYRPYYYVVCTGVDGAVHWEIREHNSLPIWTPDEDDVGRFIARMDTNEAEAAAIVKLMNDQFNLEIRS